MKTSLDKLKKISEKPWFYPMALFLIAIASYGYALTSLGYYWSDWVVMFFTKLGSVFLFVYYAADRPFRLAGCLVIASLGRDFVFCLCVNSNLVPV